MKKFTLGIVQISSSESIEANCKKAFSFIDQCIDECGAELVVLPETVTTGFNPGISPEALAGLSRTQLPEWLDRAKNKAKEKGIYLTWPTYESSEDSKAVFNTVYLISPSGDIVGKYRKTHLFPTERPENGGWSVAGNDTPVFDTPLGKIGIIICFDGDFPLLSMKLAEKGAQIILRPSAFLRSYDIWKLTNRARAYDNHVFVAGANCTGTDPSGTIYYGNSMIVSPTGQVLAHARGIEGVIYCDIDPQELDKITFGSSEKRIFDHLKDQNPNI
ncbi:carbon-nitrogen hydrolase family protein [Candidatus Calescamantes bacterium]|nr:carbon-nitrogen hydrolase family protein [Candidatus Calescamantes bacterium]